MWLFVLALLALFVINVYTTTPRSSSDRIEYINALKYRLEKPYRIKVKLDSPNLKCNHVTYNDGELFIDREFVWDGVTGMLFNEAASMRASLVHDAIYHLVRECKIDPKNRKIADELLYEIGLEDGVSWTLAQILKYAPKYAGNYAGSSKKLYSSDGSSRLYSIPKDEVSTDKGRLFY